MENKKRKLKPFFHDEYKLNHFMYNEYKEKFNNAIQNGKWLKNLLSKDIKLLASEPLPPKVEYKSVNWEVRYNTELYLENKKKIKRYARILKMLKAKMKKERF